MICSLLWFSTHYLQPDLDDTTSQTTLGKFPRIDALQEDAGDDFQVSSGSFPSIITKLSFVAKPNMGEFD